ncbi:MAG: AI-2E family transporter, partial [Pseudomonadales bacterium]|nr:AI-2E family transporter [Pseudomonadales bacterium]
LLPNKRPLLKQVWNDMNGQMANYVRGKFIEIFVVGVVSYVVFSWFELRYSALLAIVVGLSVIVPYVGAFLVTIPVALVAYLQWGWGPEFFKVFIAYLVIQVLDGNVLVPWLFSEAVNLHPVAILLAIMFFGGIWGLWGVFFAIPLATLINAVLTAWPTLQTDNNDSVPQA